MKAQVEEMKTSAIVFQASKCSVCSQQLELPTVHYMCKHSYHARCLEERGMTGSSGEKECPRCAPEHQIVIDLLQKQAEMGTRYDLFKTKLDGRPECDRYSVITEYLGKSIFGLSQPSSLNPR